MEIRDGPPRAVVLLSGGLDSATTLAIARERGFEPYALTVRYGQRHENEIAAARAVADSLAAARHLEIPLDLRAIGGSALTDEIPVPPAREPGADLAAVPITYVPARNTILLSLALAWAEVLGADDLFIGVHEADAAYPDCRPGFIEAFERLAGVATAAGADGRIRVHAPLLRMTKAEIIARGAELGVDYALTTSCYDPTPEGLACGRCETCALRRRGFEAAGVSDPTRYAPGPEA